MWSVVLQAEVVRERKILVIKGLRNAYDHHRLGLKDSKVLAEGIQDLVTPNVQQVVFLFVDAVQAWRFYASLVEDAALPRHYVTRPQNVGCDTRPTSLVVTPLWTPEGPIQ